MSENCANCRFSVPHPSNNSELVLLCRRYPPTNMSFGISLTQGVQTVSEQPSTQSHFWCGEWSRSREKLDA